MEKKNNSKNKDDSKSEEEVEDLENMEKPSYTYWKRDTDKPFSNEFKPQKSDSNLVENKTQTQTTNSTSNFGQPSAWNTAGTWEEKHLGKNQLELFLNNHLHSKNLVFQNSFVIENFSSYSGDVS